MLEKIGLPAKPSVKGGAWVIDASSCQTCQGVFTMFNRKHHCRRCGGIFCGNCTSQRAVLRGQGDAPVRICDPCKKLEEAARFQLRHRGKKGAKAASVAEDDSLLKDVLSDGSQPLLSGRHELGDDETDDHHSSSAVSRSAQSSKGSSAHVSPSKGATEEHHEESHFTPEELRVQAAEQKTLYSNLKKENKNAEALQAYKRFKELGREADALELSIKKSQRKAASEAAAATSASSRKPKDSPESAKDKGLGGPSQEEGKDVPDLKRGRTASKGSGDDDLLKTLKDLGWDEADLVEKKPKKGPTSDLDLLAEISDVLPKEATSKKASKENPTQLEILAHKRKALALKREGKPAEAKEELKKAKLLEKKLEEMELLGSSDEDEEHADDDEVTKLMRSLEKEAKSDVGKGKSGNTHVDFSVPSFLTDDDDAHVDVTDDDINDPSMVAALRAMGWDEEATAMERSRAPSTGGPEAFHIAASVATESSLQSEILTHKRQALTLKREGKIAEAKRELQAAKTLEQELEALRRQPPVPTVKPPTNPRWRIVKDSTEMRLEDILEDKDDPVDVDEEDEHDPEILAALRTMGYVEDQEEILPPIRTHVKPSAQEKKNLQDEILAVKKSALAMKRSGRIAEAKEELRQAKVLEQRLEILTAELEADGLPQPITVGSKWGRPVQLPALPLSQTGFISEDEEEDVEVSADDFMDPELAAALKSVGWQEEDTFVKDKEPEKAEEPKSPPTPVVPYRELKYTPKERQRKLQLQKDLLSHKRKALALKREGKVEEAKAEMKEAKSIEKEMDDIEKSASSLVQAADEKPEQSKHSTASLPAAIAYEYDDEDEEVTDTDMQDPDMLNALYTFGWKPELENTSSNQPSKSSSSALPALAGLDNTVSLKAVIDSGRMAEATPKEVGRFDTSRTASRKYDNPPYTKDPLVDTVSDPIWRSIVNSSSRKETEYPELGKSESSVKELKQDSSFKETTALPVAIGTPLVEHAKPVIKASEKVPKPGTLDLLSGETWSSPTNQVVVDSDSDEDEDVFDPNLMAALQSIGMAPSKGDIGKRPQLESAAGKQDSNAQALVKDVAHAPVRGSRAEPAGKSLPVMKSKVDTASSRRPSSSDSHKVADVRPESTFPTPAAGQSNLGKNGLEEEIMTHKRKALAFKREGKISEAKEELKLAKSLEKQAETGTQTVEADENLKSAAAIINHEQPPPRIHYDTPPPAVPTVGLTHKQQMQQQVRQGKDRMKLQRESLAHKRKALGLRREGKMEEAEAEFELAKSLEKQMEDLDTGSKQGHDDGDMGMVEDLLDPQLMAALKGIGWNDGDLSGRGSGPKPTSFVPTTTGIAPQLRPDVTTSGPVSINPFEGNVHTTSQAPARRAPISSTGNASDERSASINSQPPSRKASGSSISNNTFEERSATMSSQPSTRRAPQATSEGSSARPSANRTQDERTPPVGGGTARSSTIKAQEERKRLEEKIKQEKVRAVELKRAGRTQEAKEVYLGAKQLEKQLQSMA